MLCRIIYLNIAVEGGMQPHQSVIRLIPPPLAELLLLLELALKICNGSSFLCL